MLCGALPPEIDSDRMYTGPGPVLAAAAAWDTLAGELQSTLALYSATAESPINRPWVGTSSMAMATAVTPYFMWLNATAAQAKEAATQAASAAAAYEPAFAAHVPPLVSTANRSRWERCACCRPRRRLSPAVPCSRKSVHWVRSRQRCTSPPSTLRFLLSCPLCPVHFVLRHRMARRGRSVRPC